MYELVCARITESAHSTFDMASTSKIRKLEETRCKFTLSSKVYTQLYSTISRLCSINYDASLKAIKINPGNINAGKKASGRNGECFRKASCDVQLYVEKGFLLGDIFRKGIDIAIALLEGEIPDIKIEKLLLEKLVNMLESDEPVDIDFASDTDLAVVLSNHLFGKLATSSSFTIDRTCHTKRKGNRCPCRNDGCVFKGVCGDTSIGNLQVWHGSLNVIIENNIAIENLEEPDDGKSTEEVRMSLNPQLIAETIVFSFIQKQKHPERSNYLTPLIGVSNSEMLVMFYDSEHDVLLESTLIPLMSRECKSRFSAEAIVIAWLVVNYQFLCSGLTNNMLPYKANFFGHVQDSLEIYQNELQMQNVALAAEKRPVQLVQELDSSEFLLEKQEELFSLQASKRCNVPVPTDWC